MTPPEPPKRPIGFITPEDKPGKPSSPKAKAAGQKAWRVAQRHLKRN